MSFTTSCAPWRASMSACARPNPPPAPVTIATRVSRIIVLSLLLLAAHGQEAARHERCHAFLDRGEVLGFAQASRELVDAARAREREQQRAADEMISPEDIFFRAARQRALQQPDETQHDRIEMLIHQLRAPLRRVGDLRAERA